MLEYIINHALYFAHYDPFFQINDDAKKCRYLSVTNNFIFSHISFILLSHEVLLEECFAMDTLIKLFVSLISVIFLNFSWLFIFALIRDVFIVYAHGRRLCSNWVRHGSTTISYPQCSLTFMRERYLHRSFAYAKSAVGIDVVSIHKLFAYRVVSTVSTDIVSSHTKYCRIAYGITR